MFIRPPDLQKLVRASGMLKLMGKFGELEPLAPHVEAPFFYRHMGRVFPAQGERKYRVAFLSGCIANISFARLNEATVRVLQANGCEVTVHAGQTCCGALHVHAGLRDSGPQARPPEYRRPGGRRLRRHHHQRGRLRLDAQGIRRAAGA